jgi:hypothetical protein
VNGETGWVKVTYNNASGATFYVAPDQANEPSTWYQLGATQTLTTLMTANTSPLYIGGLQTGADMLEGRVYRVIVRSTVGGTVVADVNVPVNTAALTPGVETSFTATTGGTVTIANVGGVNGTYLTRTTVNALIPYYECAFDPAMMADTGEMLVMWAVISSPNPPDSFHNFPVQGFWGSEHKWFTHRIDASNNLGYIWGSNGTSVYEGVGTPAWGYTIPTTQTHCMLLYASTVVPTGTTLRARIGTYGAITETLLKNASVDYYSGTIIPGTTYGFFRLLATDDALTINVLEAGIAVFPQERPVTFSDTDNETDIVSWGRAAFDLDPVYSLGEGWIIHTAGTTPGGIGETVAENDIVYVTDPLTPAWAVIPATQGYAWYTAGNTADFLPITPSSGITIGPDDDIFFWTIVSGAGVQSVNGYFNVLEAFSSGTSAYVLCYFYPEDGDFYVELTSDDGVTVWGEVPDGTLYFTTLDEPIMVAGWLDRATNEIVLYAAGEEILNLDATTLIGKTWTFTDGAEEMYYNQTKYEAVWGRGFTWGEGVIPRKYQIDHLYEQVVYGGPV